MNYNQTNASLVKRGTISFKDIANQVVMMVTLQIPIHPPAFYVLRTVKHASIPLFIALHVITVMK